MKPKNQCFADAVGAPNNSGNIHSDGNIVLSSVQAFVNSVSGVIKSIESHEITSESAEFNNQGK